MGDHLVVTAWRQAFKRDAPIGETEEALFQHLLSLTRTAAEVSEQSSLERIAAEIHHKQQYMDASWGYIDAGNIGKSLEYADVDASTR